MDASTSNADGPSVRQSIYTPIFATDYRVVHLLPGNFSDDIQCVLETRSFRVKTRYEALSYQWGDESHSRPIQLANLDHTTHASSRFLSRFFPKSVAESMDKMLEGVQAITYRYHFYV
jgi:hypothetical protein